MPDILTRCYTRKAWKAAGVVRKTMLGAFDDVELMFSEIELFLQMYPGDENIQKASISLIAATLFAVENVITFFLKGTGRYSELFGTVFRKHKLTKVFPVKKLFNASLQRDNYEQKTIESLQEVKSQCESLHREVEKSNKYQNMQATTAILRGLWNIMPESRLSFGLY
jgi:hypothetical protein